MVRQAHHPEPSRRVNLKFEKSMTKTGRPELRFFKFVILNFGNWNLFDIWDLLFGIYNNPVLKCVPADNDG